MTELSPVRFKTFISLIHFISLRKGKYYFSTTLFAFFSGTISKQRVIVTLRTFIIHEGNSCKNKINVSGGLQEWIKVVVDVHATWWFSRGITAWQYRC